MPAFKVLTPIQRNRVRYEPGQTIDLPEAEAQILLAVGAISVINCPVPIPADPEIVRSVEQLPESEPVSDLVEETEESGSRNLINLNTASEEELEDLPAIGLVTARRIIAGRPYGSIEEFRELIHLSPKSWAQIENSVEV